MICITLRERWRISIFHSNLYSFSRHFLRITYYNWILQFISVFIHNLLRFRCKCMESNYNIRWYWKCWCRQFNGNHSNIIRKWNWKFVVFLGFYSHLLDAQLHKHIQLNFSISILLNISKSIHIKWHNETNLTLVIFTRLILQQFC